MRRAGDRSWLTAINSSAFRIPPPTCCSASARAADTAPRTSRRRTPPNGAAISYRAGPARIISPVPTSQEGGRGGDRRRPIRPRRRHAPDRNAVSSTARSAPRWAGGSSTCRSGCSSSRQPWTRASARRIRRWGSATGAQPPESSPTTRTAPRSRSRSPTSSSTAGGFKSGRCPSSSRSRSPASLALASGFEVELASGERFWSATVVVAVGTAPFAYVPPELRAAGSEADWAYGRISHSSDHHDLSGFSGKTVAVIGRGQSALETAVLLHESGAAVHLLVRSPELLWGGPPPPADPSLLHKLRTPPSQLGGGWTHLLITRYPAAYRHLPDRVRLAGVQKILGPFGAWWLKIRFEGIDVRLQTKVTGAGPHADGVRLDLVDQDGTRSQLDVDHVIAATGYRVDLHSLGFLPGELAGSVATVEGSPRLTAGFRVVRAGPLLQRPGGGSHLRPDDAFRLRLRLRRSTGGRRRDRPSTRRLKVQERDRSALSRSRTKAATCCTTMVMKGSRSSRLNQASLRRVGAPGISGGCGSPR